MFRSASNFKEKPVCRLGLALFMIPALAFVLACPAAHAQDPGQKTFGTPEEAVSALMTAAQAGNREEVLAIFGPEGKDIISTGDEATDKWERDRVIEAYHELARLIAETDGRVFLHIGKQEWPFPIPLREKDGAWYFDTRAGKEEVTNRRIGRNELSAIEVCKAYVDAQREYASKDRDNDQVLEYAQKASSEQGQYDGLYWLPPEGGEDSPMGLFFARATVDEITPKQTTTPRAPFHGYYFKILKGQGPQTPGGAYDYVINGNMIGGFALLAFPADYGTTGIMSFIVNQQGIVYQQDLGVKTDRIATKMKRYNPDKSWQKVE